MITEKEVFSLSDSASSPSPLKSKTLYKFWSGLTKLLLHIFTEKSSVSFDIFGTFTSSPPHFFPSSLFTQTFAYSTNAEPQDLRNKISGPSLSQLCKLSLETISSCQKTLVSRFKSQLKFGIILRLNLKIGYLVLQPGSFYFSPATKQSFYHASNPNPVNDDSSNNLSDARKEKILHKNVNLPPLTVQSRTTPTIINKHSKKQFIEPYASGQELMKIHKKQFKDKLVSKTPEVNSIQILDRQDQERLKDKGKEIMDNEKINRSMIEYNAWKKSQSKFERMNERYSYFPFTEGENIEEFRKKINSQRKEEFLAHNRRPESIQNSQLGLRSKEIQFNNILLSKISSGQHSGKRYSKLLN